MDQYHETNPPSELKSAVLGRESSKKNKSLKLEAKWSKREADLMIHYPSSPDGAYLAGVLSKKVMKELSERGYDVETLRFSIKRKI
jgi:hypothetical protein